MALTSAFGAWLKLNRKAIGRLQPRSIGFYQNKPPLLYEQGLSPLPEEKILIQVDSKIRSTPQQSFDTVTR
jgi:hypothetical protein